MLHLAVFVSALSATAICSDALAFQTERVPLRLIVPGGRSSAYNRLVPGRIEESFVRSPLQRKYVSLHMEDNPSEEVQEVSKLDRILSDLTSAFPLFVLSSAILGIAKPKALQWVNKGKLISIMLASVMCGTGLTLERKDFADVFGENLASVPLGVLCQFIIMPLTAWSVGKTILLDSNSVGPALFLGLVMVGCSPGGTASNLVSLIAKADVAVSEFQFGIIQYSQESILTVFLLLLPSSPSFLQLAVRFSRS